jgi:hypothetical protein
VFFIIWGPFGDRGSSSYGGEEVEKIISYLVNRSMALKLGVITDAIDDIQDIPLKDAMVHMGDDPM